MAVTRMAARNPHAVCPLLKALENIERVNPAGTGNFDYSYIGRVLKPADTRQIRTGIRTPAAKKSYNLRLKFFFRFFLIFTHFYNALIALLI